MKEEMDIETLRRMIELHSADLSRWPQAQVKPALDLVARDADARAHFDAELALDAELRAYVPAPAALAALEDRICDAAFSARQQPVAPRAAVLALYRPTGLAAQAFGLAIALFLGFFSGTQPPPPRLSPMTADMLYAADQLVAAEDEAIMSAIGEI